MIGCALEVEHHEVGHRVAVPIPQRQAHDRRLDRQEREGSRELGPLIEVRDERPPGGGDDVQVSVIVDIAEERRGARDLTELHGVSIAREAEDMQPGEVRNQQLR